MIPVSYHKQILPGSFEHSLSWLIDEGLDLSVFDQHYCNDNCKRPAYDPCLLLKVVMPAYSKGITGSRRIERLCRENITFMALSADLQPDIVEREHEQIKKLRAASRKIKRFLESESERTGISGREVKSNITDNESAKMKAMV